MVPHTQFIALADKHGTPLFVYDAADIRANTERLRAAMPPFTLMFYALKANPAPAVVRMLAAMGLGAEVASGGELELALACGVPPARIVFSGPAKTDTELQAAARAGIHAIQAESAQEIARLDSICRRRDLHARVALRVQLAPGLADRRSGWSGVSPFGMDESELHAAIAAAAQSERVTLIGVHNHQGSNNLDASLLIARYTAFVHVVKALRTRINISFVNFGGGFGAPFYADDSPLNLSPIQDFFAELSQMLDGVTFGIEPGRYLVGPAGYYVTRVVEVKRSFGTRFALLDGGTHHVLGLSGTLRVMRRPVSVFRPGTPPDAATEPTELAGPLCTPVDRLASAAALPRDLAAGDVLVFANCGAYAKHASPLTFLGHDWPAEVLVEGPQDTPIAPPARCMDLPGFTDRGTPNCTSRYQR